MQGQGSCVRPATEDVSSVMNNWGRGRENCVVAGQGPKHTRGTGAGPENGAVPEIRFVNIRLHLNSLLASLLS